MSTSSSFEFEAWCQEFEIESETAQLLKEKGFKSYRSLSKLTPDIMKKEFKTISPGQFVLLQDAVTLLQPRDNRDLGQAASLAQPTTERVHDSGINQERVQPHELLDLWTAANNAETITAQTDQGKQHHFDPFGFGIGPHASKLRNIQEFITHTTAIDPNATGDSTINIGGVEFSVAKGKKVPLEKIRPPPLHGGFLTDSPRNDY